MGELAGENSHKYADLAKNSYNEFVGTFKSGLTTLSETVRRTNHADITRIIDIRFISEK